jgi:hypothetical protein
VYQYFPAGPNPHSAPPSQDLCNLGRIVHWEGKTHSYRFPTGVTFTSHIVSYAASKAVGEYARYAADSNRPPPDFCADSCRLSLVLVIMGLLGLVIGGLRGTFLGRGVLMCYYCNHRAVQNKHQRYGRRPLLFYSVLTGISEVK